MDPDELRGAWDRSTLPANVRVGPDCYLEARHIFERFRSRLDPGLVLGARVRLLTWTTLNVEPTGYLEIGEGSTIVGAVFMCASRIVIGRRVLISYQVTIADSDFHPLDVETRRLDAIATAPGGDGSTRPPLTTRPVTIGDDVRIGIGALILKGVTVGAGARIGAGAVVTRDIPSGETWAGNPARRVDPGEGA
jgi:acetyltransferase-like isoleucine patch superfamily enzyme